MCALVGLNVECGRDIKPNYYKNSAAFCIKKERNESIKLGKRTLIKRSGKTSLGRGVKMELESVKDVKMGERVVEEGEPSMQRPCVGKEKVTLWLALVPGSRHIGASVKPTVGASGICPESKGSHKLC